MHCVLNGWYFLLDHICSSSEARVRTIWAPGLGPGSAWRGLAHKIKAVEYTERDRSRALSTLWYLSPALCKLYEGDPINADPDRSQSRHNNLTWQRYRVLFVRVIIPPLVTESSQQHCGGFHNYHFNQMLVLEPCRGLIYVGAWPSVWVWQWMIWFEPSIFYLLVSDSATLNSTFFQQFFIPS